MMKLQISKQEVMRYAMCRTLDEQSAQQMQAAIDTITRLAKHQYHFIVVEKEDALIQEMGAASQSIQKLLDTCHHVIIMGVSIGIGIDRHLRMLQNQDMGKALWHNAAANAYVEALCDEINDQLKEHYYQQNQYLSDRFSCGYGDLSLTFQRQIVERLDGMKKIGLYVNDSMMLCPEKSVTAIIGISNEPQRAMIRGCRYCDLNGKCTFQKGGMHCG